MSRFLLLMNYGPSAKCNTPMTEWPEEDVRAHIAFQGELGRELAERGELVDAQGLTGPDLAKTVVDIGEGSPVITDGPFPETKELLAGYWMVDVESVDRALEIAAKASAAPGPGGVALGTPIEVRELMRVPASPTQ
jgi:hypothetical protein